MLSDFIYIPIDAIKLSKQKQQINRKLTNTNTQFQNIYSRQVSTAMFNNNSFEVNSNPNTSLGNIKQNIQQQQQQAYSNFRPNKGNSSLVHNDDDDDDDQYDFTPSLAAYNFRKVPQQLNSNENHTLKPSLTSPVNNIQNNSSSNGFFRQEVKNQMYKESSEMRQPAIVSRDNRQSRISEEQPHSFAADINQYNSHNQTNSNKNLNSKGLLKTEMRVDYDFDQQKKLKNSKKPQKTKPHTESHLSILSMNVFSCMDNTEYERDFEISPKVISRR